MWLSGSIRVLQKADFRNPQHQIESFSGTERGTARLNSGVEKTWLGAPQSNGRPGVAASNIDGELLWGFWYLALRSDEIRGRALATSTRLELLLVLEETLL
jgi:hypothetical protein